MAHLRSGPYSQVVPGRQGPASCLYTYNSPSPNGAAPPPPFPAHPNPCPLKSVPCLQPLLPTWTSAITPRSLQFLQSLLDAAARDIAKVQVNFYYFPTSDIIVSSR